MKNKILTTIAVAVCLAAGVAQPLRAQDPSRIERSERRRAAMLGLAPSPAETPVGGQYSPHTLEDLRAELLNIADGTNVNRFPTAVVIADDVIFFIADVLRESAQDTCKEVIVALGEGGNTSLLCIPLDVIWIAAKAVNEGIHFCDDDLTGALTDASYKRLGAIHNDLAAVQTGVTTIDTNTSNVGNQISTVGAQVLTVGAQVSGVSTQVSNLDNHLAADFAALTAQLINLQASVDLANQRLLKTIAGEAQIMKLVLTPEAKRILAPSILTCTGSNCPTDLLANCTGPGGACTWNNVGPLP